MSERWREKFPCMATQTAHLKMSAPNYRAGSRANPLTLFTASSQTSVETPVKNAFSAADGVGQPIPAIPGRLVLRGGATTVPPLPPLHLHNLHRQRDGGLQQGRAGGRGGGHIHLHLAMWRDKYGSMSGAHATASFDDYTLRRPYKHADRRWKEPTPPLHLRSQVQYRHNRNKAESLSTLEEH